MDVIKQELKIMDSTAITLCKENRIAIMVFNFLKSGNLKKIMLEDIVKAIDGDAEFSMCVLGLKECSEVNPCPAHKKYKHIKSEFKNMIKTTSVFEMVTDLKNGVAYLKID